MVEAKQGTFELPSELVDAGIDEIGVWAPTFWNPPKSLSYETYDEILVTLRYLRRRKERELDSLLWWLADVLNNAEMDLGEEVSQLFDIFGLTKESLIKVRRTGEEFRQNERWSPETGVSFWLHWEVRKLDFEDRVTYLTKYAEDENYSRDDLRSDVRLRLQQRDGEENPSLFGEEGQTDGEGAEAGSKGESELPPCPLCDGAGHVEDAIRDAYLMSTESAWTVATASP